MIDAAKESLLDPDKTIGQVAGELGFQYPQHFVRFFRRYAGCTPNSIGRGVRGGMPTGGYARSR